MSVKRGHNWAVFSTAVIAYLLGGAPSFGDETTSETNTTPYSLRSLAEIGDFSNVDVLLEVRGDLKLRGDNKVEELPMQAKGTLKYDERVLQLGDEAQTGLRSLRHYNEAEVEILVHNDRSHRSLAETRRLVAVERKLESTDLYAVERLLSSDDLDLIDIPCNSLLIDALVPGHELPVGSTWPHSDHLIAALLGVDAVSANDLESTFTGIDNNVAKIEMAGTVHGAIAGVATEMDVKARYLFDTKRGRVAWIAMIIKEKRSIGHASPGLDAVIRLQMTIKPTKSTPELGDEVVANLPEADPELRDLLVYESEKHGFGFAYPRNWHIVTEDDNVVVLRMIERGELIAQCNVSPLGKKPPEHASTLDTLQHDIKQSLGENFSSFVRAGESKTSSGLTLREVIAQGSASSQPMHWHYYVIRDDEGKRLSFAFTLESELEPRLGEVDRQIVSSVQFTPSAAERAAQSSGDAARR